MSAEARALLAAIGFLTRLPVPMPPARRPFAAPDMRRAGTYFPLVGAALGAGTGLLGRRVSGRLGGTLAGALAVAAQTAVTGALHLDALADSADALGAGDRERALEVMRDPRLGSFGAAAAGLDLLVKAAALAALAELRPGAGARCAAAAGALSRTTPVVLAAALPYARPGAGTGLALTRTDPTRAVLATAIAAGCTLVAARGQAVTLTAVAATVGIGTGVLMRRALGGVTGDTLGAALELTETAVLVAAVAITDRRDERITDRRDDRTTERRDGRE